MNHSGFLSDCDFLTTNIWMIWKRYFRDFWNPDKMQSLNETRETRILLGQNLKMPEMFHKIYYQFSWFLFVGENVYAPDVSKSRWRFAKRERPTAHDFWKKWLRESEKLKSASLPKNQNFDGGCELLNFKIQNLNFLVQKWCMKIFIYFQNTIWVISFASNICLGDTTFLHVWKIFWILWILLPARDIPEILCL